MITQKKQQHQTPRERHERMVRNVAGTFAIEGITLSDSSRNNLDRLFSGQASYEQIMEEIRAKYDKRK